MISKNILNDQSKQYLEDNLNELLNMKNEFKAKYLSLLNSDMAEKSKKEQLDTLTLEYLPKIRKIFENLQQYHATIKVNTNTIELSRKIEDLLNSIEKVNQHKAAGN